MSTSLSAMRFNERMLHIRTNLTADDMPDTQLPIDTGLRPEDPVVALHPLSETERLRLKAIARLYCRGLPPEVSWEDLLQEALTRVLSGSRRVPKDVDTVAFLAGVMRSLRSAHWRRALKTGSRALNTEQPYNGSRDCELCDPAASPERSLNARQALTEIESLFVDDTVALQIISGLAEGFTAEEIRTTTGLSEADYNAARKRIRRTLLREGLTPGQD